jgi:uncharacterized protein
MDLYAALAQATGFDRDEANQNKNWYKHRVSVAECEQVFFNDNLWAKPDETHSADELHFHALGQTDVGRLIFIVFTLRGTRIRVISARDVHRKEREAYRQL